MKNISRIVLFIIISVIHMLFIKYFYVSLSNSLQRTAIVRADSSQATRTTLVKPYNIVYMSNEKEGILTSIQSILSTNYPKTLSKLHFWIILDGSHIPEFHSRMKCLMHNMSFPTYTLVDIHSASSRHGVNITKDILEKIFIYENSQRLKNEFNFARFYLDILLPQFIDCVMYLDGDSLVTMDLSHLFDSTISKLSEGNKILAVVPQRPIYREFLLKTSYARETLQFINWDSPAFNGGFWFLNVTAYDRLFFLFFQFSLPHSIRGTYS